MIDLDLVAFLPEIILTVAVCSVLVLDLFVPRERRWLAFPVSVVGVLATLAAVLTLHGQELTTLEGMWVVDQFAIVFKVILCVAALLVLAVSHGYLTDDDEIHQGEYYTMMLASLLGMLAIASSRDLIAIFVALELISMPSFVLAGIRKRDLRSNEAALKFFLFGVLSSALTLFGMSIIYGLTGATNLSEISASLAGQTDLHEIGLLAILFLLAGFGFKISAFPFHFWVPDTYEGSLVPVAAFLSVASKTAGFAALLQVMFVGLIELAHLWAPIFAVLGVVTMTYGNLVALQQKQIVRMLAYSSIAQAGYIMVPLGVASATNVALNTQIMFAAVGYLIVYAFMETGAFAAATAYGRRGGGYKVDDYAGLFSRSPVLALAMTAFLLSLAGIFPFAGWWAKFVVFQALIEGGGIWMAVIMALNVVIGLFFYAAVVKRMFFDTSEKTTAVRMPLVLAGAIAVTAVVVVVGGALPDLFGRFATGAHFF